MCPDCGAGARDDARFCLNCGSSLEPASEDVADDRDTDPLPRAGRTPSEATAVALARARPDAASRPQADDAGAELVDCANCGAANSARRVLCGRCGADLATGTVSARSPHRTRAPTDEDTGELPVQRGRRRLRPWMVIVALSVLAGGVIGGLAATETGPFATDEPAEASFSFDPEVYPGQADDLEIAQVLASSTAQPDENRYDPAMAADGQLGTAWNSDGELRPDGIGETLRFDLAQPSWVAGFVIANGYQKDAQSFLDNARLERVRISLGNGVVFDVTVLDEAGRQVVRLGEPVLTDHVTVTILDSYEGRTYEDLGLSEFTAQGWPAVGTDLEAWEASQDPQGDQPPEDGADGSAGEAAPAA